MEQGIDTMRGRKLLQYGVLLFLFGLITGLLPPLMKNPRMGLSSHLEGVLNGMFLILVGLVWNHLDLSKRLQTGVYCLSLFGTYTNWLTTLLAAFWGAGSGMMTIAGKGFQAAIWQEKVIKLGLVSLSVSMLCVCIILLWGLRSHSASVK